VTAGRIAVLGEQTAVEGFALAGVLMCAADNPDEILAAWRSLPADLALVILTPAAACSVPDRRPGSLPLTVVMPG